VRGVSRKLGVATCEGGGSVTLERHIHAAILRTVRTMGCWAETNGVHRGGTTRRSGLGVGSPDILVLVPPFWTALFIEVKRDEKAKRSRRQIEWHARAQTVGIRVETCWTAVMARDAVLTAIKADGDLLCAAARRIVLDAKGERRLNALLESPPKPTKALKDLWTGRAG